jgi:hypothetical protein
MSDTRPEQVDVLCGVLQRIVNAAYAMQSILRVHVPWYRRDQYARQVEELSVATYSFMTIWYERSKSDTIRAFLNPATFDTRFFSQNVKDVASYQIEFYVNQSGVAKVAAPCAEQPKFNGENDENRTNHSRF